MSRVIENIGLPKIKLIKFHLFITIYSLPDVKKVLSFSSVIDVATILNNNKPLGTLEIGVLYTKIPESIKTEIIDLIFQLKIMKQE